MVTTTLGSFVDPDEYAKRMGMNPTSVRLLCRQGKIKGARRVGSRWKIPLDPTHDDRLDELEERIAKLENRLADIGEAFMPEES